MQHRDVIALRELAASRGLVGGNRGGVTDSDALGGKSLAFQHYFRREPADDISRPHSPCPAGVAQGEWNLIGRAAVLHRHIARVLPREPSGRVEHLDAHHREVYGRARLVREAGGPGFSSMVSFAIRRRALEEQRGLSRAMLPLRPSRGRRAADHRRPPAHGRRGLLLAAVRSGATCRSRG